MTSDDTLERFSERMKELCEENNMPERGRQTLLGKQFGLTANAARKWLRAEGMPELPMAVRIANWAGISVLWLLQGTEPKRPPRAMSAFILNEALQDLPPDDARAAVHYIGYTVQQAFSGKPSKLARYMRALKALESQINNNQAGQVA